MRNVTEHTVTEAVLARIGEASDPRLRQVMAGMVRHLHDFVREVEPTEAEWMAAIRFLTEVGRKCDHERQEFILLSDTLGATVLVDAINNRRTGDETPSTVLGPFHLEGAPDHGAEADLVEVASGEPCLVRGRVLDAAGRPLADAVLDVWQAAGNGLYSMQDPGQPPYNLRGRVHAGRDGGFAIRTVKPVSYPVPTDGPVGRMLAALGRHPFRPAHIHFIVSAPGCRTLTTQLFVAGDPYIDSDAVFGVKDAIVVPFEPRDPSPDSRSAGIDGPHWEVRYDFRLARVGAGA